MKQLDELMEKINSLHVPIYVKGKEYPGNNPYILNEINIMLKAGWMKKRYGSLTVPVETLELEDLKWEDTRIRLDKDGRFPYLVHDELWQLNIDNCNKHNSLSEENNERLARESENS
jgi:hypothetical protein